MNFSKQLIMEIGIDNCRHLADFVVGFGQLHLPFIALYSPQPPIVSIVKAKSCNSMQNIVSRFISHRMLFAKAITPISTNNAFLIISTFFIFVVVFSCYSVYYSSKYLYAALTIAEKPNKKTDEAIMPSPYFHEPFSKSLNSPSMPIIKTIHANILIAAGTMNDSLPFSLYRLP